MLARIFRRVSRFFTEMDRAQRRGAVLLAAPDRYLPLRDQNKAPATYTEFLFRTSGPLLCEPSATNRARGQLVRLAHRDNVPMVPSGRGRGEGRRVRCQWRQRVGVAPCRWCHSSPT